jgi:hypothetical protein
MTSKRSSVSLPREIFDKLDSLSKRTRKSKQNIILEALSLYETQIRRPRIKEDFPITDKIIWYMMKLSMSIGALKENPTEINFNKTMKTISQIRDRLKVNTSILEKAVQDFYISMRTLPEDPSLDPSLRHDVIDEATMEINMALKSVLIEIFFNYIYKEAPEETSTVEEKVEEKKE